MISIKNPKEIESMRISGRYLAEILKILADRAVPGITPKELSKIASEELKLRNAKPAFLGVGGNPPFPDVICISVNEQVQHSIPTNTPLEPGDIVNFDFGVTVDGMITDAGLTVCVSEKYSSDTRRLLEGTKLALDNAIKLVEPGIKVGDISAEIEATLKKYRLGIVRELVGHGVGHELHEDPEIPNYGRAGLGPVLRPGMTIAIEPITTIGKPDIYQDNDGWTLKTWDGSWSAQFEHTILVTESGHEVLTEIKA